MVFPLFVVIIQNMKMNSVSFLQKLILRFKMQMAAILLRQDYFNGMEFNALDSDEFSDEYLFAFQDLYKK